MRNVYISLYTKSHAIMIDAPISPSNKKQCAAQWDLQNRTLQFSCPNTQKHLQKEMLWGGGRAQNDSFKLKNG